MLIVLYADTFLIFVHVHDGIPECAANVQLDNVCVCHVCVCEL